MDIVQIFVIAVVEGLTEFLPISSTGHMIVVAELLNIPQTDILKAFEVIIQLSATLAILLVYRKKVSLKKYSLWLKTIVAFLPIGIVGFLFADAVKALFDVQVVAYAFIVGGMALLFSERIQQQSARKRRYTVDRVDSITFTDALKIGIFQTLALIPGMSRSGATIFGGMALGVPRMVATEFAFLAAVPVMFTVAAYDLLKYRELFSAADIQMLVFASVVAFIASLGAVLFLLRFLEHFSLFGFGVYRILFGVILLLFFV